MDEWRFPIKVDGETCETDDQILTVLAKSRGFNPERVIGIEGEIIVTTEDDRPDLEDIDPRTPANVEADADSDPDRFLTEAELATLPDEWKDHGLESDAEPDAEPDERREVPSPVAPDEEPYATVLRVLAVSEVRDGWAWATATDLRNTMAATDVGVIPDAPTDFPDEELTALVDAGLVYCIPRQDGDAYRADFDALCATPGVTCADEEDHDFAHGPHTGFDATVQIVDGMDEPSFYPELQDANPAFEALSGYLSALADEGTLRRVDAPEDSRSSVAYVITDEGESFAERLREYRVSRVTVVEDEDESVPTAT